MGVAHSASRAASATATASDLRAWCATQTAFLSPNDSFSFAFRRVAKAANADTACVPNKTSSSVLFSWSFALLPAVLLVSSTRLLFTLLPSATALVTTCFAASAMAATTVSVNAQRATVSLVSPANVVRTSNPDRKPASSVAVTTERLVCVASTPAPTSKLFGKKLFPKLETHNPADAAARRRASNEA